MSDPAERGDDIEVRKYAEDLWSSGGYREWRNAVRRAVADGSVYEEPPLDGISEA